MPPQNQTNPSKSTAFPAPLAELMGKTALTIRWVQVPEAFLRKGG